MRLAPILSQLVLTGIFLAATALVAAPKSAPKKPLTYEVYDSWRSVKDTVLSRSGEWLAYTLAAQDGDGEVVLRNLKNGQEWRHPRGSTSQFTADARFVAFAIAPPKAEVDKAKKDKKKPEEMPKAGLGVMDLATGKVETLERVKSFRLGKEGGRFLAALLEKPEERKDDKKEAKAEARNDEDQRARPAEAKDSKKKEPGTELVIWELGTANRIRLADVTEYLWNRAGAWLAYAVSMKEAPKEKGDKAKEKEKEIPAPTVDPAREGVYVWRASDRASTALLAGQGTYKGLAADDAGRQLAFLSNRDDAKLDAPAFKLFGWKDGEGVATELASGATPGLPKGWTPSEHGALDFSKDGARLFFGTAPAPKAEPKDGPEPVKVDLWHWKDPELQPMQKVRAEEERKRSFRAVVHLAERSVVQLGAEELPDVEVNENPMVALGYAPNAYLPLASWDQGYADVFALDLKSGARRLLAKQLPWSQRSSEAGGRGAHLSPGGRYHFHFDEPGKAWVLRPTAGGESINLTRNLRVAFHQEEHDTPELPGSYGFAGWTEGDAALVVYDRYDVWELKPGAARNLTAGAGRKERTGYRYLRLDPEERTIPTDRPMLLSAMEEDTKSTGFSRASWMGEDPVRMLRSDQLMGGLLKAKSADTVVFTRQRFDLFPDLWVSDLSFAKTVKVSDANPQQKDFLWGRQELMEYVNGDGKLLKALAAKPENFDPAKKYPLMVYIYEKYSDALHRYQAPAPGTNINFSRYTSNGYVVLRPDIEYEIGYPGKSAMKCVLPAIEKLASLGYIDRTRIGIQGHSWGGYQIAYMVGQTNIFKAAEAGAPVSDMLSAYGGIRWGSGMSRAFQYEKAQSRIGAAPWERPLQFIENSPLFWVERVQTPLLMLHNDEDDAVPWYQGIEYFTALRRLGKPVWMFNFNGDKHGLGQRENQKYWTVHLDEYFDHLLLGAPRPAWMDQPVPYNDRGKRDLKSVYDRK